MVSTPPAGYRLEYLTSAPGPELYDDLRALLRAMDRDVPQGEFGAVGHRYSDAALRTKFDAGDESQWIVIARSQDGSVAGYTELRHPVGPTMRDRLMQCDTVVLPKHRGHGLGIAMKSAALARACADVPGLAVVQTSVDQSNRPMLAINSRLGFQESARLEDWVWTRDASESSS